MSGKTSATPGNGFWRRFAVAFLLPIAVWLSAWLAARCLIVNAPLEHADGIVMLSGSSTFVERADLVAKIYRSGVAKKIILTNDNRQGGWLSSEQRNPFFYERARWELERLGVPAENIEVIGPNVSSTQEEALALRDYVKAKGLHSIVVVTSGYHSRRALQTFHRVLDNSGVEVGLVAVPPGWQTPKPSVWWLSVRGWLTVPNEYLKMIYYWIQY